LNCFGRLIAANVSGLAKGGLLAKMFKLGFMFFKIPNVQFSTEPAILLNGF
jgi:hypothetical protein